MVEVSIQKRERKLVIVTLGEGDLLGEVAIIDQLPRTATAQAVEDTQVVAIPLDYINQKVDCADPTVRFFLQIGDAAIAEKAYFYRCPIAFMQQAR